MSGIPDDGTDETLPLDQVAEGQVAAKSEDDPSAAFAAILPQFPGYDVEAYCGMGGMARVYRARQSLLNRPVALKVLRQSVRTFPGGAQQFLDEMRLACRVDHPNIVTVHDAGKHNGQLYLAMEWLPAGDLATELRHHPKGLPVDRCLHIGDQLMQAIQALSDRHIVHRDLKPGNVLVAADGVVKLADFGIAHLLQKNGKKTESDERLIGSPSYMAPEQLAGVADIDVRTDIYGWATTLYTLLVGYPPFQDPEVREILRAVLLTPPQNPRDIRPEIPEDFSNLLMACLAKDRKDRPQTPAEVHELLATITRKKEHGRQLAKQVELGHCDEHVLEVHLADAFAGPATIRFNELVLHALTSEHRKVVIHGEKLSMIGSDGLASLISVHRFNAEQPIQVVLRALLPDIVQSLDLVGLTQFFVIEP